MYGRTPGFIWIFVLAGFFSQAFADEPAALIGHTFTAVDSLNIGEEADPDAQACLAGLDWSAHQFPVRCEAPARAERGELLVRFPSPVTTGNPVNDLVAVEWYMVKDEAGAPIRAQAVVVVHESGKGMGVGRLFAEGFRQRGVHAFLVQLPTYGERKVPDPPNMAELFKVLRQAIADVRRARDAVAVLPYVNPEKISLQGTSLGSFVASTTAGLDHGYDCVFLMLSGGNIIDIIEHGERESAQVRKKFEKAGVTMEEVRELAWTIEPNRLAHRLNPERTWLYSGTFDTVIPFSNALSLAKAAGLDRSHHLRMPANHVTGIIFMPVILDQMVGEITGHPVIPMLPEEFSNN